MLNNPALLALQVLIYFAPTAQENFALDFVIVKFASVSPVFTNQTNKPYASAPSSALAAPEAEASFFNTTSPGVELKRPVAAVGPTDEQDPPTPSLSALWEAEKPILSPAAPYSFSRKLSDALIEVL